MVRINRVYTRAGDDGTTALVGGQRVPKDSPRIDAYGTVDELNSTIGLVLAFDPVEALVDPLTTVQQVLFNLGSRLALDPSDSDRIQLPPIEEHHVRTLEGWIDAWNDELPALKSFVLPGGHPAAAHLHLARTVCRRAEREVLHLSRQEQVEPLVIAYLNRLSDLFFVASRYQNHVAGATETLWDSRAF